MRESNYWLRVTIEISKKDELKDELSWLINESNELKNILGSIVQKTRSFKILLSFLFFSLSFTLILLWK
jgi:hypothetical protein